MDFSSFSHMDPAGTNIILIHTSAVSISSRPQFGRQLQFNIPQEDAAQVLAGLFGESRDHLATCTDHHLLQTHYKTSMSPPQNLKCYCDLALFPLRYQEHLRRIKKKKKQPFKLTKYSDILDKEPISDVSSRPFKTVFFIKGIHEINLHGFARQELQKRDSAESLFLERGQWP